MLTSTLYLKITQISDFRNNIHQFVALSLYTEDIKSKISKKASTEELRQTMKHWSYAEITVIPKSDNNRLNLKESTKTSDRTASSDPQARAQN